MALWLTCMLAAATGACGAPPVDGTAQSALNRSELDPSQPGHGSGLLWMQTTGEVDVWRMSSSTSYQSTFLNSVNPSSTLAAATGDFTGDGVDDIMWFSPSQGSVSLWVLDGLPPSTPIGTNNYPGMSSTFVGDLDGDGISDVIWTGTTALSGTNVYTATTWLMSPGSTNPRSTTTRTSTTDQVAAVGNFDGDSLHRADILYRSPTTGAVTVALSGGATLSLGAPTLDWVIKGVGDFNGDGTTDVLWYNTISGDVSIWVMSGGSIVASPVPGGSPPSLGWTIVGVGDVNRDGISDIIWRHSSGVVSIWTISSPAAPPTLGNIITPPAGSSFVGVIDLDSVVANFDYSMPDMFGADNDGDGAIDLFPSAAALTSLWSNSWTVNFDACSSVNVGTPGEGPNSLATFAWTVADKFGHTVASQTTNSCTTTMTLPQGGYAVTLKVTTTDSRTASLTKAVFVRNYLIVSMGDSYASGEGNPYYTEPEVTGNAPFWGTPSDQFCHRTANSAHARAALSIERADPHSSVSFLSVACSGSSIPELIDVAYGGADSVPGISNVPAQITQVQSMLCPHGVCGSVNDMPSIDAILLSTGGNDVGFKDIIESCVAGGSAFTSFLNTITFGIVPNDDPNCSDNDDFIKGVYGRIDQLWPNVVPTVPSPAVNADQGYANLAQAFAKDLNYQGVYIVEYPDPTHDSDGSTCQQIVLQGAKAGVANGIVGQKDLAWASQSVIGNINAAEQAAAAALPKWHYVGGTDAWFNRGGYCAHPSLFYSFADSWANLESNKATMHPDALGQYYLGGGIAGALIQAWGLPRVDAEPSGFLPVSLSFDAGNGPSPFPLRFGDWSYGEFKAECPWSAPVMGLSAMGEAHSVLCKSPFVSDFWTLAAVVEGTIPQLGTQELPFFPAYSDSTGGVETFATWNSADFGSRGDWDVNHFKGECPSGQFVIGVAQTPAGQLDHLLCGYAGGGLTTAASPSPAHCQLLAFPGDTPAALPDSDWAPGFFKLECNARQLMVGISTDPSTHQPHGVYCCDIQ
jgi:hypothetical protein